jgi:hypothetical protein
MTNEKLDYKKEYPDLYMPKAKPSIVEVPPICFITVDGKGNPNTQGGEYPHAVELLYALSYTIKMSKMGANKPDGYFEYVVPPLEGLWWLEDGSNYDISKKDKFCWTSMIRQPEFVTQEVFEWACKETARKKPELDTSKARLKNYHEGLCVQMMHIGPYDDERETIAQIDAFVNEHHLQNAIDEVQLDGSIKRHHEIYVSDPHKIAPQKLKTVLRHPVK